MGIISDVEVTRRDLELLAQRIKSELETERQVRVALWTIYATALGLWATWLIPLIVSR